MKPNPQDAFADTPTPSTSWSSMSDAERLQIVANLLRELPSAEQVQIIEARADGEIILSFKAPVPADVRGGLLLDLEAFLKQTVDPALNVWLEPLGDKNSLRNLRGIEVK